MKKNLRVWNSKAKKMYGSIELEKLVRYLIFETHPNSEAYTSLKDDFQAHIWMMGTNVLDCTGKEIFEGDLLKLKVWDGDGEEAKDQIFIVVYSESDGCFTVISKGLYDKPDKYWLGTGLCDEDKIVGNIYQNPELFKDSSKTE